ncbi:MAG: hypothetical protein ACOCUV_03530 [bacterium]
MKEIYTIIMVLRSGGDFSFSDVLLLSRNIKKHWSEGKQLKMICLYDGVTREFHLQNNLTLMPLQNSWPGWWSRMQLYNPEMEYLRPYLYLDLDTAIVGDISNFYDSLKPIQSLITLEDFYRKKHPAAGVVWYPKNNEDIKNIWSAWWKVNKNELKGRSDNFLNKCFQPAIFLQDVTEEITTFKPMGKGWLKTIPEGKNIICFHGKPRIPEAAKKIKWVHKYISE